METPPSLNDYIELRGLPESRVIRDWELLLLAFQLHVKVEAQK